MMRSKGPGVQGRPYRLSFPECPLLGSGGSGGFRFTFTAHNSPTSLRSADLHLRFRDGLN